MVCLESAQATACCQSNSDTARIEAYRHVEARTSESPSDRVNGLSAHAEVAQFDHTIASEKDVRRLDIAVNNPAFV